MKRSTREEFIKQYVFMSLVNVKHVNFSYDCKKCHTRGSWWTNSDFFCIQHDVQRCTDGLTINDDEHREHKKRNWVKFHFVCYDVEGTKMGNHKKNNIAIFSLVICIFIVEFSSVMSVNLSLSPILNVINKRANCDGN